MVAGVLARCEQITASFRARELPRRAFFPAIAASGGVSVERKDGARLEFQRTIS